MSSATNSSPKGSTPAAGSQRAPGGSPVAYEAPVIATGARPGENSGKRELFTETTTTALVFTNGGVLRLSVAVEPGQLLCLTNQQSNREVVAQVTRRRDNPATGYYVELEFTEPAPGFWGIEIPDSPTGVPANAEQRAAAELLRSPKLSSDDPAPRAAAPSAAEIHGLMEEVEALRAQLKTLQTQAPAANPVAAPAPLATLPPLTDLLSSFLTTTAAPAQTSTASVPQTTSAQAPTPALPAEPTLPEEEELAPEEDLAPEPVAILHQPKASKSVPTPSVDNPTSAHADRLGPLRLALLSAVSLFAVTVAAWNMHWFPWSSPQPSFSGRSAASVSSGTHSSSSVPSSIRPKAAAPLDASSASQAASALPSQPDANALAATAPNDSDAETSRSHSSSNEKNLPVSRADSAPTPTPAPREESQHLKSVDRRSKISSSTADDVASTSLPSDDAGTVPPRLIKSVRAVAPADALRDYVTGNVTLDALIDESGHVKSMKVLSGPSGFHKAAMEALRQYRYEPARRDGKRVSAHVTVTVPFWFEP